MKAKKTKDLVSVIIPTLNRKNILRKNLKALKEQTYKNIEIIVVDDGSTDKTINVAKKFTNKVFARKHAERSVQRNFGVSQSIGKYLLVIDDDMKLSPNVIKECVEVFESDISIGAVTIPEVSVAKTYWEKVKAFERSFYNQEGDEYTDAARFFTREAFEKVGGYDETITGPEDWDLPDRIKRAGYKQARIKSVIYHYERVPNPFKVALKKFYYGLKAHRYFTNNKINPIGPKTLYFMRPVFYKNWKKLLSSPILSLSMFFMLTLEQLGGGLGYFIGRFRKL